MLTKHGLIVHRNYAKKQHNLDIRYVCPFLHLLVNKCLCYHILFVDQSWPPEKKYHRPIKKITFENYTIDILQIYLKFNEPPQKNNNCFDTIYIISIFFILQVFKFIFLNFCQFRLLFVNKIIRIDLPGDNKSPLVQPISAKHLKFEQ